MRVQYFGLDAAICVYLDPLGNRYVVVVPHAKDRGERCLLNSSGVLAQKAHATASKIGVVFRVA